LDKVAGQQLVPTPTRQRVALAEQRVELLQRLHSIAASTDGDRLERLLAQWDESLLAGCADAESLRPLWEQARVTVPVVARLRQAIAEDDSAVIERLLLLVHDPGTELLLPGDLAAPIQQFRQRQFAARQARRQGLLQALVDNDGTTFRTLFDGALVGELAASLPTAAACWIA